MDVVNYDDFIFDELPDDQAVKITKDNVEWGEVSPVEARYLTKSYGNGKSGNAWENGGGYIAYAAQSSDDRLLKRFNYLKNISGITQWEITELEDIEAEMLQRGINPSRSRLLKKGGE